MFYLGDVYGNGLDTENNLEDLKSTVQYGLVWDNNLYNLFDGK